MGHQTPLNKICFIDSKKWHTKKQELYDVIHIPGLRRGVFANEISADALNNLEATPSEVVCLAGAPTVLYKVVRPEALLQKRRKDGYWHSFARKSPFAVDVSAFIREVRQRLKCVHGGFL